MRIVLIGTVDFSRHCLEELLAAGGNVVGIFTQRREDSGFNADYADLSEVAAPSGIPVFYTKNINAPEQKARLAALEPDVIFVFGWSRLIDKEIIDLPPGGCIGTHPALLPKNRGRHPIVWALVEGLPESGLTFFYLDEGADSGDILWQKPFPITHDDDAASLYAKIKDLASEAIRTFLPLLAEGTAPRIPQDHAQATYWRKRTFQDGAIDWTAPTETIFNLVRALTHPYVGAHTHLQGEIIKIWRAAARPPAGVAGAQFHRPGRVVGASRGEFLVRTGDGYLTVLEYERPEGRTVEIGTLLGETA